MNWKFGNIKFHREDKGFGFVEELYSNGSEYYFSNKVTNGLRFEPNEKVLFKIISKNGKTWVSQIEKPTREFHENHFKEYTEDLIQETLFTEIIENLYKEEIKDITNKWSKKVEELSKKHLRSETLLMEDFIDGFSLELKIYYSSKLGDDDSLLICYELSHNKVHLSQFKLGDSIGFNNSPQHSREIDFRRKLEFVLFQDGGFRNFRDIEDEFRRNQMDYYLGKIPDLLKIIKSHIRNNFEVIERTELRNLDTILKRCIKVSVVMDGLDFTIQNSELSFEYIKSKVEMGYWTEKSIIFNQLNDKKIELNIPKYIPNR